MFLHHQLLDDGLEDIQLRPARRGSVHAFLHTADGFDVDV
jgi:hypothetical protein